MFLDERQDKLVQAFENNKCKSELQRASLI